LFRFVCPFTHRTVVYCLPRFPTFYLACPGFPVVSCYDYSYDEHYRCWDVMDPTHLGLPIPDLPLGQIYPAFPFLTAWPNKATFPITTAIPDLRYPPHAPAFVVVRVPRITFC